MCNKIVAVMFSIILYFPNKSECIKYMAMVLCYWNYDTYPSFSLILDQVQGRSKVAYFYLRKASLINSIDSGPL